MIGVRRDLAGAGNMCLKVVLDRITGTEVCIRINRSSKVGFIALRKRLRLVNSTSAQSTCSVEWAYWRSRR